MFTNLFSIFDPKSFFGFSLNWISMVVILILPPAYWLGKCKFSKLYYTIVQFWGGEINSTHKTPKWEIMVPSLFILILLNNSFGLLPWVFTATSHISITLSLGLPVWVGWFILQLKTDLKKTLATMTPMGISFGLALFLALVETLSLLIRPMTLAIRLAANMIAGHLILSLATAFIVKMSGLVLLSSFVLSILILLLEIAVSFIQAYVFAALLNLYM